MLGTSLSNKLKYKEQEFDEKFEKIFNLTEKVRTNFIVLWLFYFFILFSQIQ